nr:hypothetical protein [uncultured Roseibium sp.]
MKLLSYLSALGFLAISSVAASAAPVKLGKTYSDIFGGGGNETLRIINTGTPNLNQRVRAGGFRITDTTNNFDLVAWCLDIAHSLTLKGLYEMTNAPFSNTFSFSDTQKTNIESLFETAYLDLDLSNDNQSAGFQLALWEIAYESSGTLDVQNGTFSTVASMGAVDAANAFLGNLGGQITQSYQVDYYESLGYRNGTRYSQNLVSVTPVPLPAAGLLLAFGLTGLYLTGTRKKPKAAA